MKKYHDQVLRDIHNEVISDGIMSSAPVLRNKIRELVLTSSALPARYYYKGFKNLDHLSDVAANGQNTSMMDLEFLSVELLRLVTARSPKSHHVSQEFYDFIVETVTNLRDLFYDREYNAADRDLDIALNELKAKFSWRAVRAKLDKFIADNPMPIQPDGCEWKKYSDYRRSIEFGAYWRYYRIFAHMQKDLNVHIQYMDKLLAGKQR